MLKFLFSSNVSFIAPKLIFSNFSKLHNNIRLSAYDVHYVDNLYYIMTVAYLWQGQKFGVSYPFHMRFFFANTTTDTSSV